MLTYVNSSTGPVLDTAAYNIKLILLFAVTPVVSLVGIIGNVLSIMVLVKQSLKKCSNVLLFGLAVSDLMFLLGFNSFPKLIYAGLGYTIFSFSKLTDKILFISFEMFLIIDYSSGYVSITLPMLITVERLVAVFYPLKFSRLITPKRTWSMMVIVFVFWYLNVLYTTLWFDVATLDDLSMNKSDSYIQRSATFRHDQPAIFVCEEIWANLSMRIAPLFTFIGCIVICIKIKVTTSRRKKLTRTYERKSSMYQTTKTLLAVCGMYTLSCMAISLPVVVPEQVTYLLTDESPQNIGSLMYQIINLVVCLNSSCNFIIYIALNTKFRQTYKSLLKADKKKFISRFKRKLIPHPY